MLSTKQKEIKKRDKTQRQQQQQNKTQINTLKQQNKIIKTAFHSMMDVSSPFMSPKH